MNGNPHITAAWLAKQFPDLQNIEPLSSGGQKQVFSAQHSNDGDVVFKLIHPGVDVERITRELVAVASIHSPRVPGILGQGIISTSIGDCFWLREQRIHGHTVRECLANGPLDTSDLLRLALHISEVLVSAEDINIVHRDVKPENIILDSSGDFWLLDFTIARHLTLDSLTATANVLGHVTWGYAPIEQCLNMKGQIDSRADLFAFGVTLYECSTGINPFSNGTRDLREILQRLQTVVLPPLQLTFSSASEFSDLITTLTQRNRVHRPQNAREAHNWIREICAREQVQ